MATDTESAEELGSAAVADISAFVARRFREEHLYHFIRSRDELLRLERPDDSETIRLLRSQYLRSLEKTWDSVLQTLRTELPKALDQLFSNFKPEFRGSVNNSGLAQEPTTLTVRTTAVDKDIDDKREISIGERDSVFDSADEAYKKRALDPEMPTTTSPEKKTGGHLGLVVSDFLKTPGYKAPIKRSTSLYKVEDEECIFSRSGYQGVYVLRCDIGRCKMKFGRNGPTIFTSHPFRDRLALDHFDGEVHHINSESEIFWRFAIRGMLFPRPNHNQHRAIAKGQAVMDADTERNLEKKDPGVGVANSDDVSLRPTNPQKSSNKGKGKEPERPYNLYVQ
ncbi:hypothetical protein F5B17DRAFT_431485 [Nemania serpens]|nr:hypothetical protein F5B17DRAFT_431485 [Nemania serpens]